jgi:Fe2+ or Zn2+ uptake regulation protein
VAQLKAELKRRKLKATGLKLELLERLKDALKQPNAEALPDNEEDDEQDEED